MEFSTSTSLELPDEQINERSIESIQEVDVPAAALDDAAASSSSSDSLAENLHALPL